MPNSKIPSLKSENIIHILAPAGSFSEDVNTIKQIINSNKFTYNFSEHALHSIGYFSGTDEQRIADLQQAINNPEISAILCARGGDGVSRIIDNIDFRPLVKFPKWIIGLSDITAIHLALAKLNIPSIHGPMIKHISEDKMSADILFKFLKTGKLIYEIDSNPSNVLGIAKGEIIGGNVSLLVDSLGTQTQLRTENKILFIEEIGEPLYKIDRMLNQLKRSGILKNITGLIVGQFTEIKPMTKEFGFTIEELIKEKIEDNIPIAFKFPAGHEVPNYSIPFGITSTLELTQETVVLTI